jgi:hypothetical protein
MNCMLCDVDAADVRCVQNNYLTIPHVHKEISTFFDLKQICNEFIVQMNAVDSIKLQIVRLYPYRCICCFKSVDARQTTQVTVKILVLLTVMPNFSTDICLLITVFWLYSKLNDVLTLKLLLKKYICSNY